MTSSRSKRQKLIDTSLELFLTKSYHTTSMNEIATACDITKATIYHYLDSREELLLTMLQQYTEQFTQDVLQVAFGQGNAKERLQQLGNQTETFFNKHKNSCIFAKLTHEILDSVPPFNQLAQKFFQSWVDAINHILSDELSKTEALSEAQSAVFHIQGALLFCKLYNDKAYLTHALEDFKKIL